MNPWGWLLLAYIAAVTIPLIVIDVRSHRLPNRLVLPGYLVAAVTLVAVSLSTGAIPLASLIAAVAYVLFLFARSFAGGMGMGDVKLAGVLGAAAGLVGKPETGDGSHNLHEVRKSGQWGLCCEAERAAGRRLQLGGKRRGW